MSGISALGVHLPRARLARAAIAGAMGWLTPGLPATGTRSLGFWDEDSTTMAVAAARRCLAQLRDGGIAPASLDFATLTPAFAERQNASILRAALRLPAVCTTQDCGTSRRATLIALHRALEAGAPALIVGADRPIAPAGSPAEAQNGDGAAAAAVNMGPELLTYLGGASLSDPMAEGYRAPSAPFSTIWEERWVREEGWLKLGVAAIAGALRDAGLEAAEVDHLILASTLPRIAQGVAAAAGLRRAEAADTLAGEVGDTGCAHALLMLAAALPRLRPGQIVLIAGLGQGASALLFRATEDIRSGDAGYAAAQAAALPEAAYTKLPLFSGLLAWDPGPRGRTPITEALTTAHRHDAELLGFTGARDPQTGRVRFPRGPGDGAGQEPWPLADRSGVVVSRTADSLAFSPVPPACYGLVDFDGGGRLMMEFTDPDAATIRPGDPVRFVFRVKEVDRTTGFRRYFWKAVHAAPAGRPIAEEIADATWS